MCDERSEVPRSQGRDSHRSEWTHTDQSGSGCQQAQLPHQVNDEEGPRCWSLPLMLYPLPLCYLFRLSHFWGVLSGKSFGPAVVPPQPVSVGIKLHVRHPIRLPEAHFWRYIRMVLTHRGLLWSGSSNIGPCWGIHSVPMTPFNTILWGSPPWC